MRRWRFLDAGCFSPLRPPALCLQGREALEADRWVKRATAARCVWWGCWGREGRVALSLLAAMLVACEGWSQASPSAQARHRVTTSPLPPPIPGLVHPSTAQLLTLAG